MDENQLENINDFTSNDIDKIGNYLRYQSWIVQDTKEDRFKIYINTKQSQQFRIILPLKTSLSDFNERMTDVILLLAKFEERTPISILHDISLPISDIIRIQIKDELTKEGTIAFDNGIAILEAFRKALTSAAYSLIKPERYHKRIFNDEVEKFMSVCRLGQTEKGSYISTIFCPVENIQLDLSMQPIEQFGRKATINLMKSLDFIQKSVHEQNIKRIISPESTDPIVSANLCDALLEMKQPSQNYEISFDVSWAKNEKLRDVPTKVSLKNAHMESLDIVSVALKPNKKDVNDTFIGKVSQLKGEAFHGKMQGEVILTLLDQDDDYARAKISLNYKDYNKALKFHGKNSSITIKGRLVKESMRINRIVDYSDFSELTKI